VYLCYTKFINTMQAGAGGRAAAAAVAADGSRSKVAGGSAFGWDYIYEPDAQSVIDELLVRYVEALVYQAVAENMASEQSARMVAMKAATDNAGNLIGELKLVYNKTRQAGDHERAVGDRVWARRPRGLSLFAERARAARPITHQFLEQRTWLKHRPRTSRKRSFSASAPSSTSSSRATRCRACTTH
jgi:hypothetical protein